MKLGRRIKTASALRRVLQYIANPAKARLIDTNLVGGHRKAWLTEVQHECLYRPSVGEMFVHFSVSCNPTLQALSAELWEAVVREHLARCGFGGCTYAVFRHLDTSIDHVHVLVSRLRRDGTMVRTGNNFYRWREALRSTEKAVGLTDVGIPPSSEKADTTPDAEEPPVASDRDQNARRRAKRRGNTSPWIDVDLVNALVARSTCLDQLQAELRDHGIDMDVAMSAQGTARGLKFRRIGAEEWLAGSSLDRSLTLPKIVARIDRQAAELASPAAQLAAPSFSFGMRMAIAPERQEFTPDFARPRGG